MTAKPVESTFSFLQGGGEMGELTRNYPWGNTSLGSPGQWPQSLRTTISIVLSSKFPMFLFWGKEHVCFYNDSYRPSLGNNGKHPTALGQQGKDCWPEIWPFIKPLIDQVLSGGGATWNEDQLLPIYRNGKLEDVYWTFSYMPVNDESGEVNGVLVVCSETTDKIANLKKLAEREQFASNLFNNSMTAQVALSGNDMVIYTINKKMLDLLGRDESVIGKPFIEVLPELSKTTVLADMQQVLATGQLLQKSEERFDLVRYGKPYTGYYNYTYEVLNEEGKHYGLICTAIEVTEQVLARKKIEKSESRFKSLIEETNFASCLFTGPDMVIEVANDTMIGYWGKGRSVMGKPLAEALPELQGQPFLQILDDVYTTGETFAGQEAKVEMVVDGVAGTYYFDYTYTALRDDGGKIYGVIDTAIDVTEKVIARQKIEKSESSFRRLVQEANFACALFTGRDMVIEVANNTMVSYWGKGQSIIGKPLTVALPELVGQSFPQIVDEVYTTGKTFIGQDLNADLVVGGKPGSYYFDITYTALRNEGGDIYGVMNTAIDVTEKVLARRKTEEAKQRLRLAVESADLGTYEVNYVSGEMFTSNRFNDIWGFKYAVSREEFATAIHPADLELRAKALQQATQTGALFYEARIIWKDGSVHWVRVRGKVIFDSDTKPVTLIGVVQDISEQKNFAEQLGSQVKQRTAELETARKTLLEANEYQQGIINSFDTALASLVPVFEGDRIIDFRFKTSNTTYALYSRLSPEEVQGKRVSEVFPGYYQTAAFERYADTFNTGISNKWELNYNMDGLNVHLQVTASKIGEEVVVNFNDITRMKQLQIELLQNIKDLKRSNEDLQQFAHVASHDLKEPLRKIRTFSSRISAELAGVMSEKVTLYMSRIESAASRMSDMIDGVLLYSSAGANSRLEEQVNLNEVVEQIEGDLEMLVQQKDAKIIYENLPVIEGSKLLLHQLFYNLVLNSLKFSRQEAAPLITISSGILSASTSTAPLPGAGKQYVSIRLQDNGIGFGQNQAQYIFKTFTRLHAKDKYEGSGIGLALCQKIAERHGGTIEAEGREGAGAIFTVILPVQQA